MMVDVPANSILFMYENDIIYFAENLSKLLANEIFEGILNNVSDFENPSQTQPDIKFWLD